MYVPQHSFFAFQAVNMYTHTKFNELPWVCLDVIWYAGARGRGVISIHFLGKENNIYVLLIEFSAPVHTSLEMKFQPDMH